MYIFLFKMYEFILSQNRIINKTQVRRSIYHKTLIMFVLYIYIYIYICQKKSWKKPIDPKFDEFIMTVDIGHFNCNNHLQDFKFMKNIVEIVMIFWWNNRKKESVYKKKDS